MKPQTAANFEGLRVAAFESRRAVEMAELITRSGGDPLVTPSMREIPLEENTQALAFGDMLAEGRVDVLILTTGVGLRTLVHVLSTKRSESEVIGLLSGICLVARGPKPVSVLKGYGLKPAVVVPEPNTWREVIAALDKTVSLNGKTVAVQEYGITNDALIKSLADRNGKVVRVPVYRWALPENTAPLKAALEEVIEGKVDVVIFTNANQITNVMQVAKEHGLDQAFHAALSRAVVASVGPTTSEYLDEYGFAVDIEPEHSKMGPLVKEASVRSGAILRSKRSIDVHVAPPPAGAKARDEALQNSLFMRACRKEPVERTPIWLMRQAGRYLKSYRDIRAQVKFIELCKDAELAQKITVDTVARLGVDAAIIFSDILLIVEPMGMELEYAQGDGPVIHAPIRQPKDVDRILEVRTKESLPFLLEAIRKARLGLPANIPLIGFSAAPFTLASYMIEGKTSRNFIHTKSFMLTHPSAWKELMTKVADTLSRYLNEQVEAGAQAVQLFDSWVGCLSPGMYERYVQPYSHRTISHIRKGVPVIHFGTQTSELLSLMKDAGGDVLGLDWRVPLGRTWKRLGDVAVQGNLDPTVLFADRETVVRETERILREADGRAGHIFNLGHGVLPHTPVSRVHDLIRTVKEWKA